MMATLAQSLARPRRFPKPLIVGSGVLNQNWCLVEHDGPWVRLGSGTYYVGLASWRQRMEGLGAEQPFRG